MPSMIEIDDMLIRINSDKGKLEHSLNDGRTWNSLYYESSSTGEFYDLLCDDENDEILAATSNGIFFSRNKGKTWNPRFRSSRIEFQSLKFNGDELLAQTSDGLYYSRNVGRTWARRHR